MRQNAFRTHHKNQERLQQLKPHHTAGVKSADGTRFQKASTADHVIYCAGCSSPVIDTQKARDRHAKKSAACGRAMSQIPTG